MTFKKLCVHLYLAIQTGNDMFEVASFTQFLYCYVSFEQIIADCVKIMIDIALLVQDLYFYEFCTGSCIYGLWVKISYCQYENKAFC